MLRGKGFSEQCIAWMIAAVQMSKVCVNLNRENGEYFRTFRGLRLGDPLSLLLFDAVADALGDMISAAKHGGHL